MKISNTVFAVVIAAGSLVAALAPASAMPVAGGAAVTVNAGDSSVQIEQAGWRCGPGRHMTPYGRCVFNRRPIFFHHYHRRWYRY